MSLHLSSAFTLGSSCTEKHTYFIKTKYGTVPGRSRAFGSTWSSHRGNPGLLHIQNWLILGELPKVHYHLSCLRAFDFEWMWYTPGHCLLGGQGSLHDISCSRKGNGVDIVNCLFPPPHQSSTFIVYLACS